MSRPRGSSAETRQHILEAARDLFARHGVDSVSVRQIAAAAGVTHPLVHRYFGTKTQMVAEILRREIEAVGAFVAVPTDDVAESSRLLRSVLRYALTNSRTTLLLILRAEMDGLAPGTLVDDGLNRPLAILRTWLGERDPSFQGPDPRIAAALVGAAVFGFAAVEGWLTQVVGLGDMDEETIRGQLADTIADFILTVPRVSPCAKEEKAG